MVTIGRLVLIGTSAKHSEYIIMYNAMNVLFKIYIYLFLQLFFKHFLDIEITELILKTYSDWIQV